MLNRFKFLLRSGKAHWTWAPVIHSITLEWTALTIEQSGLTIAWPRYCINFVFTLTWKIYSATTLTRNFALPTKANTQYAAHEVCDISSGLYDRP